MQKFNRNIGILASGGGTTTEYVIRATQTGVLRADVKIVISNNEDAGVFDRVDRLNEQYNLNISKACISPKKFPGGATKYKFGQTDQESTAICGILEEHDITLVALLGYLRKVRGPLMEKYGALPTHDSIYQARMVNTHPGPLPETRGYYGAGVHEKVAAMKLPVSAQVLHVVSESYDEGSPIATNEFPVYPDDTPEIIEANAQSTEKAHLPPDIERFMNRREVWAEENQNQT